MIKHVIEIEILEKTSFVYMTKTPVTSKLKDLDFGALFNALNFWLNL